MIKSEVINGENVPDEIFEKFMDIYDQISDALLDIIKEHLEKDYRFFLSVFTVIHADLVAFRIQNMENLIDIEKYIEIEKEALKKNIYVALDRLKKDLDE